MACGLYLICILREVWHGTLPDLHPFPAGAHVLPQEEAVEGHRPDQVEQLLHHLPHELGVQAILTHGGVEVAQLLQDGCHGVGVCVIDTGGALPETGGLQTGNALQALILQHSWHCGKGGRKALYTGIT